MFTIAKLIKIMKPYIKEGQLGYYDKNLFNSFYSTISQEAEKPQSSLVIASTKNKKKNATDSQTKIDFEDDFDPKLREENELLREFEDSQTIDMGKQKNGESIAERFVSIQQPGAHYTVSPQKVISDAKTTFIKYPDNKHLKAMEAHVVLQY